MTNEMRSRVLGLMLSMLSRGQFPHREPIGYLYGHVAKEGETPTHTINEVDYVGAELPKLPEWDTTAYPYAVIVPYGGSVGKPDTMYRLYLVAEPFANINNTTDAIPAGADRIVYYAFDDKTVELPEGFPMADRRHWEYEKSGPHDSAFYLNNAVWTNTDINKYGFGAGISLAASDCVCIPIYEKEE